MRKFITICLLIMPFMGFSQSYRMLPDFYQPIDSATIAQNKKVQDKTDFGVTLGTGFSSFSGNAMMQSYIAPHFNYQVNENIQFQFTGVIARSNSSLFSGGSQGLVPYNSQPNSYAISGSSIYQPNDKMQFHARGTYVENSMQPFSRFPQQQQTEYKSISFGMNYKLGENASFGVEFQFSDGLNPYYSPYRNMYNSRSSFFNDPFFW